MIVHWVLHHLPSTTSSMVLVYEFADSDSILPQFVQCSMSAVFFLVSGLVSYVFFLSGLVFCMRVFLELSFCYSYVICLICAVWSLVLNSLLLAVLFCLLAVCFFYLRILLFYSIKSFVEKF